MAGNYHHDWNRRVITPLNPSVVVISSRCNRWFAYGWLRTAYLPVVLRGCSNCVRPSHSRNIESSQMPTLIGHIPLPLSMATPPPRAREHSPNTFFCTAGHHLHETWLSGNGILNTRLVQLEISPSQTMVAVVYVPQGLAAANVKPLASRPSSSPVSGQGVISVQSLSPSVAAGRSSNRCQLGRGSAVSIGVIYGCVAGPGM